MTVLHCATRCEGWTPCSVGLSVTNEFPDLQLPLALDVNGGAALHKLARKTKSPSSTRSLTLRIVAPLTTPLDPTRSHNARARREARDAACGAALLGGCRSQEVHPCQSHSGRPSWSIRFAVYFARAVIAPPSHPLFVRLLHHKAHDGQRRGG